MYFKLAGTRSSNEEDIDYDASIETKMSIISNGNVGIGTEEPSARLHIISDNNGHALFTSSSSSNDYKDNVIYTQGDGKQYSFSVKCASSASANSKLHFRTFDASNNISGNNILTLSQNKNVGIATSNPESRLHITAENGNRPDGITLERTDNGQKGYIFMGSGYINLEGASRS